MQRKLSVDIRMMQPKDRIERRNARGRHMPWRKLDVDVVVHRLNVTHPRRLSTELVRGDLSECLILRQNGEELAALRSEIAA